MSKRYTSTSPPSTRPSSSRVTTARTPVNFAESLYDELVLNIFSHLTSHRDLCNLQRTNSNWARLSLDNQLWKALYLREFGKSRLRGSRGRPSKTVTRSDGREVRPLPSRAITLSDSESVKDWKSMFRISSNWRQGRCTSEELIWDSSDDPDSPVHVALVGGLIITVSSSPSAQILLHLPQRRPHSTSSSISFDPSVPITAIALDQSRLTVPNRRLVVFHPTGLFRVLLISLSNPANSVEVLSHTPSSGRHRTNHIIHAVYHHPLLITLSSTFDLTLYELPSDPTTGVRLAQTLTSFTSFPPTSLILSRLSSGGYKFILAYSVPIYPSHWTVAITELIVSSFTVQSTRTSSAFDLTPGWKPLSPELSETLRDQYSRKVSEVSCVSSDGRYVALSGAEMNTIQLYRLASRSNSLGPKLSFIRTLFGHVSPVRSLCVADGRCVSLSRDGSLWVWDLDRGGVEIDSEGLTEPSEMAKIAFDERQIFVVLSGKIVIRTFDV